MCTATTYKTKDFYFGRTLDYDFSYGESVVITPRNFPIHLRKESDINTHYAIIGMATVINNTPLYFEGINDKGLGVAGLNFVNNAHYNSTLSKDKKKRDQLTSMVIFFAGIGSGGIGVLIGLFSPGNILTAYTLYSIIACVAIIAFQTMVVMKVKEGRIEENKEEKGSLKKTFEIIFKNKQLLWAALGLLVYDIGSGILGALIYNLYYLEYGYDGNFVVVMTGMGIVTMILQALYPKITKNLTRKKIQWYSFIAMTIGYIFIACIGWFNFLPFTPLTLSIGYFFIGVGGAYFYITSLINMTNCVEYNEYLTGERNEAVVSAVRPLIVKFGTATKSLLTTIILIGSGLYMLSQNVSNLETQKNLINDRVVKLVNKESIEDIKLYITKINEYSSLIEGLDSDSNEYKDAISFIEEDIDSLDNDVMKRTQTNAEYIHIYEEMCLHVTPCVYFMPCV